jgi:phosphate-selective porin OprO/OprP
MTDIRVVCLGIVIGSSAWADAAPAAADAPSVAESATQPAEPPPQTAQPAPPPARPRDPAPRPVIDRALIEAIVDARIAAAPKTAGWGEDGFFIRTSDGSARIAIGGYTQFDGRFFVADAADPHVDQFGFRSIRPELKGTVFDHYDFRVLPDFAGNKLTLQDAYVEIHYSDVARLRLGKFKVPFGLERLQRDIYTTFVERGMPSQLTPNRDLGVQLAGELAHGVFEYEAGVFNGVADAASGNGDVADDKEGAARVIVKPFARRAGTLDGLGIGAAATFGSHTGSLASPDTPVWTTQAQTTFFAFKTGGTSLADTVIADGTHWRASAQGYYYGGPLGVLGEYVRSTAHFELAGTHERVVAEAWQVLAQWVITGEPASYASVVPRHAFDPGNGHFGAFDFAARASELRLVDGTVFDTGFADPMKSAKRAYSTGAGVDWFPNRALRFAVDLERTSYTLGGKTGDRPAETSIIGRAQTVF